jgi:hypothetical protein
MDPTDTNKTASTSGQSGMQGIKPSDSGMVGSTLGTDTQQASSPVKPMGTPQKPLMAVDDTTPVETVVTIPEPTLKTAGMGTTVTDIGANMSQAASTDDTAVNEPKLPEMELDNADALSTDEPTQMPTMKPPAVSKPMGSVQQSPAETMVPTTDVTSADETEDDISTGGNDASRGTSL